MRQDMPSSTLLAPPLRPLRRTSLAAVVLLASALSACGGKAVAVPTITPGSTVVSLAFDDADDDQFAVRDVLSAHRMHATFFVNSGRLDHAGHMTAAQVQALAGDGNEIGGHTIDHPDLVTLDAQAKTHEICDDRTALLGLGLGVSSFAYPFADADVATEQIVRSCGYESARSEGSLLSPGGCPRCPPAETIPPQDPFRIRTPDSVKDWMTPADLQSYVTNAEAHGGGWVIVIFHHVCDQCDPYAVSLADFSGFLDWLAARSGRGTQVLTIHDLIRAAGAP